MRAPVYSQLHDVLLAYTERALQETDPTKDEARRLVSLIVENKKRLGIALPVNFPVTEPRPKDMKDGDPRGLDIDGGQQLKTVDIRRKRLEKVLGACRKSRAALEVASLKKLPFFENIEFFKERAKLDDDDVKILTFFATSKSVRSYRSSYHAELLDSMLDYTDEDDYFRALGQLIDLDPEIAKQKLTGAGSLVEFGLIEADDFDNSAKYGDLISASAFQISDSFANILFTHKNKDTLIDALIGRRAGGDLVLADFDYMADAARHLIETVRGASEDGQGKGKCSGIYGVPGVGKTEFMYILEKETDIPVYLVGDNIKKDDGDLTSGKPKEPKRSESFSDLLRASFIIKRLGMKAILVKDEAEGILTVALRDSNKEDTSNKGFINNFLDTTTTPVILITNDIDVLQLAIKRRLVPWTRFPQPPTNARARILAKQHDQFGLKADENFCYFLADKFAELSPGVTFKILRGISWRRDLRDLPEDKVRDIILDQFRQQELALNNGVHYSILPKAPETRPDEMLWSSDSDLDQLQKQLAQARTGFVLSLTGPKGSGKRTFAYAIADTLGLRPVERSSSDLPFGTGNAFEIFSELVESAKADKSLLIFSEQDHLATHEVLDQYYRLLDESGVPAIITIDDSRLNPAPTHQLLNASYDVVRFDYLSPLQAMLAYHHFFDRPSPPVMQTFKILTPAIFANIKSAMERSGIELGDKEIVEKLHRRVGEYKGAALIPINRIIGYTPLPDDEISRATQTDHYMARNALVVRRGVPLSLDERYAMLKGMKNKITWGRVERLLGVTGENKPLLN